MKPKDVKNLENRKKELLNVIDFCNAKIAKIDGWIIAAKGDASQAAEPSPSPVSEESELPTVPVKGESG